MIAIEVARTRIDETTMCAHSVDPRYGDMHPHPTSNKRYSCANDAGGGYHVLSDCNADCSFCGGETMAYMSKAPFADRRDNDLTCASLSQSPVLSDFHAFSLAATATDIQATILPCMKDADVVMGRPFMEGGSARMPASVVSGWLNEV